MSKRHKVMAAAAGGPSSALEAPGVGRAPEEELTDAEIAERAYSYWEARGCRGGVADEDWFRAIRELTEERQK